MTPVRKTSVKSGFAPISMQDYIKLHLQDNPDTTREEVTGLLRSALRAYKSGVRCDCGNPIWVIGSAFAGNACFTCITGEAWPDTDYEIDEAL